MKFESTKKCWRKQYVRHVCDHLAYHIVTLHGSIHELSTVSYALYLRVVLLLCAVTCDSNQLLFIKLTMDSCLEPISATEEHPFCAEVMKRLDIQRRNELFCDVIIEVGSGDDIKARLKAHRNVLSSAGPFFFNALNSDMKEKQEGVIRLKDASKAVMEKVLDYLYTGQVEIHKEIAYDLFIQADYFLLPNLKALTSKFIVEALDITNCIMAYHFAIKYKDDELLKGAKEFILENFLAVAGTDDFLDLSIEEIEEFISSDKAVVKEEEDVFRVIVKWMENSGNEQGFFSCYVMFAVCICHPALCLMSSCSIPW